MAYAHSTNGRSRLLRPLTGIGTRAAASTLRPLHGAVAAALGVGINLERRAVDRVLDSDELERIVIVAVDSARVQDALARVLESEGAKRLVDGFFDSGLFDRLIERLSASDALWRLIDQIAQSPTVTAAISQQGLGFADEVGDEMRERSRKADDWLERAAHKLVHRRKALPSEPGVAT
jgi:hypothetical protein